MPMKKNKAKRRRALDLLPLGIAFAAFFTIAVVAARVVMWDGDKHIDSARKLEQLFLDADYDLAAIRSGAKVPRLFIKSLPPDFNMIEPRAEKKRVFIKFLLPLVLLKNEELREERERAAAAIARKNPGEAEREYLAGLHEKYKTTSAAGLLAKLDEVPVSLALAQAIEETGWGESRFLIHGNALFAEWTWSADGMIPKSRGAGKTHRVKSFPTLYDSIGSYVANLNAGAHYADFRKCRNHQRAGGKRHLAGLECAWALRRYSTKGAAYVKSLELIIRANNLHDFDAARLADGDAKGAAGQQYAGRRAK